MQIRFDPNLMNQFKNECDWAGLRFYQETTSEYSVRDEKFDSQSVFFNSGVMVEVLCNGNFAYVGTSDLSETGIKLAFQRAKHHALSLSPLKLFETSAGARPAAKGHYKSPRDKSLDSLSVAEICDHLIYATQKMNIDPRITSRVASAMLVQTQIDFISSNGSEIHQDFEMTMFDFQSTASDGGHSQYRTANGFSAVGKQRGAESFDRQYIEQLAPQLSRDALALLSAPNCPSEKLDLLLSPDQMLLQIHESIGHPLELDRILGDERNYAGWSFVKPADFGKLQYGSLMMNVTFDPTIPGQLASYNFDDSGHAAKKEYLIKDGLLVRSLGSADSVARSGIPGVANHRSSSWNRAPIDRMANINLEPGNETVESLIAQTEKGILMRSNRSWSIDDYRNKFQFGCEFGQLIENGKLTQIVKNPNYRGQTISFWNSLKGLSNSRETYGTAFCGKGEPNQAIRVGHASPWALFKNVEVFGGES